VYRSIKALIFRYEKFYFFIVTCTLGKVMGDVVGCARQALKTQCDVVGIWWHAPANICKTRCRPQTG